MKLSLRGYPALVVALIFIVSLLPMREARAAPTCFGRTATIVGTGGNDKLVGTTGADVIVGRSGADIIRGRGGNDRICGGSGVDKIAGGGGRDRLSSGDQGCSEERDYEVMEGNAGRDHLVGGPCLEKLYGGKRADVITDPSSLLDADWLFGGAGHDEMSFGDDKEEQFGSAIFAGGPGDDVMQGDPDSRGTLDYSNAARGVTVDLVAGQASGEGRDSFVDMRHVVGSQSNDTLIGDASFNGLGGGGGNDTISGADGDDAVVGNGGKDVLNGGSGDDSLTGGPGADSMNGGEGTDLVSFNKAVHVDLAAGTATGEGADTLAEIEDVHGSRFNDTILGDDGPNSITDQSNPSGDDVIDGRGGDDILAGQFGGDRVSGGDGDDEIRGGRGKDELDGGPGNDTIDGGPGTDTCTNGETVTNCE
jgi:Ca2+-binding RTX toxin-like protein